MKEEEDVTWPLVIEECLKRPDDPIAKVLLEVHADMTLLKMLCHSAYKNSDIRLNENWVADYNILLEGK